MRIKTAERGEAMYNPQLATFIRAFDVPGCKIHYPVLSGFGDTREKCHAGGFERDSDRFLPNDSGAAFAGSLGQNSDDGSVHHCLAVKDRLASTALIVYTRCYRYVLTG